MSCSLLQMFLTEVDMKLNVKLTQLLSLHLLGICVFFQSVSEHQKLTAELTFYDITWWIRFFMS